MKELTDEEWLEWVRNAVPGVAIPAGYNSDILVGVMARRLVSLEQRIADLEQWRERPNA